MVLPSCQTTTNGFFSKKYNYLWEDGDTKSQNSSEHLLQNPNNDSVCTKVVPDGFI